MQRSDEVTVSKFHVSTYVISLVLACVYGNGTGIYDKKLMMSASARNIFSKDRSTLFSLDGDVRPHASSSVTGIYEYIPYVGWFAPYY